MIFTFNSLIYSVSPVCGIFLWCFGSSRASCQIWALKHDFLRSMHLSVFSPTHLLWSNRAGVWWLSHRLWTRREESPGQNKVGGIAAKTSCLYSTSVQSWMISMGTISSSHFSLYRAFLSTRPTRLGEPPPVSLLLWSRGGLVIGQSRDIYHGLSLSLLGQSESFVSIFYS